MVETFVPDYITRGTGVFVKNKRMLIDWSASDAPNVAQDDKRGNNQWRSDNRASHRFWYTFRDQSMRSIT
jgi:hypothetical protein